MSQANPRMPTRTFDSGFKSLHSYLEFRGQVGSTNDPGSCAPARGLEKLCERISPGYISYLWPVTSYHQSLVQSITHSFSQEQTRVQLSTVLWPQAS